MEPTNRTARTRRLARAACVLALAAVVTATAAPAQAAPAWGPTVQVDLGPDGTRADGQSLSLGISGNGRYALFGSSATNLLAGTAAPVYGLYVRDLRTGRIELVSRAEDDTPLTNVSDTAGISGDGRYIAFAAEANGAFNLYVRDRVRDRTRLLTGPWSGVHHFFQPSISADGRYIAFMSSDADVVPGAPVTPDTRNVYVTDRVTGATRLVSVGADGQAADGPSESPTISADGRTVGYGSKATNLVQAAPGDTADLLRPRRTTLYATDLRRGTTVVAGLNPDGTPGSADQVLTLSPDGRFAVYGLGAFPLPGGKSRTELFLSDLRTGRVKSLRTSANPDAICWGSPGAAVTDDDRWVYFSGGCSDTIIRAPQARYDLYRQDLRTDRIELVSTAADGTEEDGSSTLPFVTDNGRTVLFSSVSGNLVPGDPGVVDWHVYARSLGGR
ncbi:TolB family protein [Kitasatospora sp. NPDC057692]|uniref:TolB family protein n=1 Tax=Kitasatospora sp. NPDC057692 TaxID=3346215 RepID=UPI0036A7419D